MKKLFLFLFIISTITAQENIEFFDPYELKRGMKGYALTVFQGLEPEKMDVEVIAFMPNKFIKAGMILVRLSGKNIERTGVAAGMSGSPVYIDNKLVGALAYTWANSKELLAGIVPIQDMVSDKKRGQNVSFVPFEAKAIQTSWAIEGFNSTELLQELQNISPQNTYSRGIEEFITIPSSISNGVPPLKPGDAVAIKLIEGDLRLASIGTVTYVNGEDVYIYGHPMDSEGPISLPLARAEIYDIIPSSKLSFKIGSALPQTIGSTLFDGLSSVYGRFDKQASMVPVTVNIKGKNYSNSYNISITRSRKYLPTLLSTGIGAILERELGNNIEKQVKLSWQLKFTNNQVISNSVNWVRYTSYEPNSLKEYWKNYISILWQNDLTHLVPTNISFDLEILDEVFDYYAVTGIKLMRDQYFAGETVSINVDLQKYLADTIYTNISLPLPKNIETGTYTLIVGSEIAIELELIDLFPEKYMIRTVEQLFKELRKPINTHSLQVVLVDVRTGSIIGNDFFNNIPEARQSLFESQTSDRKEILVPRIISNQINMDYPVVQGRIGLVDIIIPSPLKITN